MRWSQPSLFFIFAVLILGEVAICAPIYVDSDIVLEARSPVRTRSMTKAQSHVAGTSGTPKRSATPPPSPRKASHKAARSKAALGSSPLRAAHFKKSSATYRRAALKAPTFHRTGGGLVKTKTGRILGPGKQADHMVEAQTVARAAKKAGLERKDLTPKTMKRVKDAVNHPDNMAVISAPLNNLKGQHTRDVLAGGSGSKDPHLKQYTMKTAAQQVKVAKGITDAFKQSGKSVDVLAAHMDTMKLDDKKKDGKKR